MRKKGFTLIELLAVIVILAIIAVITVPKVAEMIDSSRKGAAQDAFYGSLKSAELAWAKELQENSSLGSVSCTITSNVKEFACKDLSGNKSNLKISVSGVLPESGKITLSYDGAANVSSSSPLIINGYKCYGNSSKATCIRITQDNFTAANTLISKVVTTGDGLYADSYESGRYVYKGADPSNYITFNGEEAGWRIISVESDGTIKIIRNNSINDMTFDSQGRRDSGSSGAGGTYCASSTYGCNAWMASNNFVNDTLSGTVLKDSEVNVYLNTTYKNSIVTASYIEDHEFKVGPVTWENGNLESQLQEENSITWYGSIGLMNASDYIKSNNNTSECGNLSLNNANSSVCKTTTWMQNIINTSANGYMWTMNPRFGYVYVVLYTGTSGNVSAYSFDHRETCGVAPTLYLKSDITLTGEGTIDSPYEIG